MRLIKYRKEYTLRKLTEKILNNMLHQGVNFQNKKYKCAIENKIAEELTEKLTKHKVLKKNEWIFVNSFRKDESSSFDTYSLESTIDTCKHTTIVDYGVTSIWPSYGNKTIFVAYIAKK